MLASDVSEGCLGACETTDFISALRAWICSVLFSFEVTVGTEAGVIANSQS